LFPQLSIALLDNKGKQTTLQYINNLLEPNFVLKAAGANKNMFVHKEDTGNR